MLKVPRFSDKIMKKISKVLACNITSYMLELYIILASIFCW